MAGCGGSNCSCKVVAGRGVRVTGAGNLNNPYVIDAYPMSVIVQDSSTVNLTLTGTGTESDPLVVTGDLAPGALNSRWGKWSGSQAAYDALGSWDAGTLYGVI